MRRVRIIQVECMWRFQVAIVCFHFGVSCISFLLIFGSSVVIPFKINKCRNSSTNIKMSNCGEETRCIHTNSEYWMYLVSKQNEAKHSTIQCIDLDHLLWIKPLNKEPNTLKHTECCAIVGMKVWWSILFAEEPRAIRYFSSVYWVCVCTSVNRHGFGISYLF